MQSDFALRTLLYLAAHPDDLASVRRIAEAYGISAHHLAKVAQRLQRAGLVECERGAHGGMRLGRPAHEIRLGEVVRRLEPDVGLVECFDVHTNTCPIAPVCGLKSILRRAHAAFVAELDRHTVADAAAEPVLLAQLLAPSRLVSGRRSATASRTERVS